MGSTGSRRRRHDESTDEEKTAAALKLVFVNLILILVCFVTLIPILYAFSVSINEQNSLLASDSLLFRGMSHCRTIRKYLPKSLLFYGSKTALCSPSPRSSYHLAQGFRRHIFFKTPVRRKKSDPAIAYPVIRISVPAVDDGAV